MTTIACTRCARPYPATGLPYRCPDCQGLFDFEPGPFVPGDVLPGQPGIWRYRHAFGLDESVPPLSLGEGNTPLVEAQVDGRQVAFKCEYQNPTGSFKDRGSVLIAAWLRARGIREAVEDSSGNAGASLAAYAAQAGIRARIYVPASASGPKRRQIEVYGAEPVPVPGTRTQVSEAVLYEAEGGTAYASHAHLPFNLPGYATAAFEIFEQLGGRLPGTVIVPAGQGGLLLGLGRGFRQLQAAYPGADMPCLIGVQARACAPLWSLAAGEAQGTDGEAETATLAEGILVRQPARGPSVVDLVLGSGGHFRVVEERAILPGRDALARLGLYVEPTSAVVWEVLKTENQLRDPVVVVLTGSGLKYESRS
jgi:threonine synthase